MRDAGGRSARIIDKVEAAHALFAPIFSRARDERLCVAHLAADFRLIGFRLCYAPPGEPVDSPVREIIADALNLGSRSLILAHNHPSGDTAPSAADIEMTRSLVQVARPLGVSVRDHLIYARDTVMSFRQQGLL